MSLLCERGGNPVELLPQYTRVDYIVRDAHKRRSSGMRSITLRIRPDDGFHPADNSLATEDSIERVAVHHIQLLDDGTVVLLYQLSGDLELAKQILVGDSDVLSCEISGDDDGVAFIHSQPTNSIKSLLELPQRYELAIESPMESVGEDGMRATLVGENSVLRRALADVPDTVELTLERTSPYQRHLRRSAPRLTERQQEVVAAAVEAGYYEIPRQLTQEELAQRLGISTGTLHEHLRKIEKRVFQQLAD